MKQALLPGKKVVGDAGYKDITCSASAQGPEANSWGYVRARHEAVNKRIKQFMVFGRRFRHSKRIQYMCFHAAVNLTQLMIENGKPVFD